MKNFKYLYDLGKNAIKDKNVIFCSIVRNCAHNLQNNIPTIEKIGSFFTIVR